VAPTEHVSWRGGLLRGQVHDENAWAFAGHGLAGHAGLFGTSMAVAGLGCAVLDALAGRCEELGSFAAYYCTGWRNGGTLRAGFDGKSALRSSAGSLMGPCSFGHLGFTGTSLWCDPERRLVIAVLTNRVCPTRRNARLVAARGSIHDSLAHAVEIEESGRC
jgi:CubicO group peptidase (beta-lactamase class C family)